jgi:hypothetical protein
MVSVVVMRTKPETCAGACSIDERADSSATSISSAWAASCVANSLGR